MTVDASQRAKAHQVDARDRLRAALAADKAPKPVKKQPRKKAG